MAVDYDTAAGVSQRQRARYGGMKFGADFFGWLIATTIAVVLTAATILVRAVVDGGWTSVLHVVDAVRQAAHDPQTVSPTRAGLVAAVLFVAYYAGGYVAGRMARFDGARQGFGVWLWAVLVAAAVTGAGIADSRYNMLARLQGFPRVPLRGVELATPNLVAFVVAALVALIGAIAGGAAGVRFHRRVDRIG